MSYGYSKSIRSQNAAWRRKGLSGEEKKKVDSKSFARPQNQIFLKSLQKRTLIITNLKLGTDRTV